MYLGSDEGFPGACVVCVHAAAVWRRCVIVNGFNVYPLSSDPICFRFFLLIARSEFDAMTQTDEHEIRLLETRLRSCGVVLKIEGTARKKIVVLSGRKRFLFGRAHYSNVLHGACIQEELYCAERLQGKDRTALALVLEKRGSGKESQRVLVSGRRGTT
ncbi:hypothetical protein BC835DRAFT_14037 [Cytidiella melzeri]|nr:hypothetical protein BC835DRAFT_14037 [Cytidiella melzeri]